MVNYSKWDNLDDSDDDEDNKKPRVQKFDGPQSITFGGNSASGGTIQTRPVPVQETPAIEDDDDVPMEPDDADLAEFQPGDDHREDILQCRALAQRALGRGDATEAVRLLEKAMRIGGAQCPGLEDVLQSARRQEAAANSSMMQTDSGRASTPIIADSDPDLQRRNGGVVADRYSWTQTTDCIVMKAFVPEGTKAKDVAVKISDINVSISIGGKVALAGEWEYKVEPEEDPDWEMKTVDGRRVVQLTVKKAAVPGGMSVVVWWRRVLKGDPTIDVDDIQDRKKGPNATFVKAWEEAHVQFKQKVKERVKTVIDVPDTCEKPYTPMEM